MRSNVSEGYSNGGSGLLTLNPAKSRLLRHQEIASASISVPYNWGDRGGLPNQMSVRPQPQPKSKTFRNESKFLPILSSAASMFSLPLLPIVRNPSILGEPWTRYRNEAGGKRANPVFSTYRRSHKPVYQQRSLMYVL